MQQDLLWLLAVVGALFWVVLPAAVLVLALVYRGGHGAEDEQIHACLGYNPADPAAKPCFVPAGTDYCPRHAPGPAGEVAIGR